MMFWKQRLAVWLRELLAGMLIGIGGMVFLACSADTLSVGKYIGALLFSVALSSILLLKLNLYTGMVGYLPENHGTYAFDTAMSVVWNFVGAFLIGFLRSPVGNAEALCAARLEKSIPQVLIDAFLCGILIYICVDVYRKKNRLVAVFLCVPTFILCGFEHSIADAFYFANARMLGNWRTVLFLFLVVTGNAAGCLLIPVLLRLSSRLEKKPGSEKEAGEKNGEEEPKTEPNK